jgi:hypothetical protein
MAEGTGADAGAHAEAQTETTADADTGDRAREGLEHLQAAARELIQAARAMLDVAEDLVNDPETVSSMAGTVAGFGDLVRRRAAAGGPARRPRGRDAHGEGDDGDDDGDDDGPAVERITVL